MYLLSKNPFLSQNTLSILDIVSEEDKFVLNKNSKLTSQEYNMYIAATLNSFSHVFIFPKSQCFNTIFKKVIEHTTKFKESFIDKDQTFTFDEVSEIARHVVAKEILEKEIEKIACYAFVKINS